MLRYLIELISNRWTATNARQKACLALQAALEKASVEGRLILCNLGCGVRHHPAWINIDFHNGRNDVIEWDLRRGLPLPNASCDVVYSSHTIEHFDRRDARHFMDECFRVLKPSGVVRMVAPDLEDIARSYLQCLEAARRAEDGAAERYEWIVVELLDQLVRHKSGGEMLRLWSRTNVPAEDFVAQRVGTEYWRARQYCVGQKVAEANPTDPLAIGRFRLSGEVHQWMYDRYSLGLLMARTGFVEIRNCTATESSIKNFVNYGLDSEHDGTTYKPDSFFIEARKP